MKMKFIGMLFYANLLRKPFMWWASGFDICLHCGSLSLNCQHCLPLLGCTWSTQRWILLCHMMRVLTR